MFTKIKEQVNKRLQELSEHTLMTVNVGRDELYEAYINALPEDEKQSHRCSCCRHFLRDYGHIVAVTEDGLKTVWDFLLPNTVYSEVPFALSKLVLQSDIKDYFLTKSRTLGTDHNYQETDRGVKKWEHFYAEVPISKVTSSSESLAAIRGGLKSCKDVFGRSLEELSIEATSTVLELINDNALYRGEEHKAVLANFLKHQKVFKTLRGDGKQNYIWKFGVTGGKIRNTAIGTLLINLSEGKPVEEAVRMFESLVAPANYKRPKALVTAAMLQKAEQDISELGYTESLERRYANIDDIPPIDVLYMNRGSSIVSKTLFDTVREQLPVSAKSIKSVNEVSIDDFVSNVLPKSDNVEILVEGRLEANLMTLIAPTVKESKSLFPWDNGLSWDYKGNVADSVKERVKAQGGVVDGLLRISLDWFNYDDLDLHVFEPSGVRIYHAHRTSKYGALDVDMNAGGAPSREAVENVTYKKVVPNGEYRVVVKNYNKKENIDFGFNIEIECGGELLQFHSESSPSDGNSTEVCSFVHTNGVITLTKGTVSSSKTAAKTVWGTQTNTFNKVASIMHSPNHWGGLANGNRHTFFILDGVSNEEEPRGFFNEFLKPELIEHKRVFELLGSKAKVGNGNGELSGLGFSSTKRECVVAKVAKENKTQMYKINF